MKRYDFSDEIPAPQASPSSSSAIQAQPAGAGAFKLEPSLLDFKPQSVAWVLQRYYEEFRARIGKSQMYTIRRLQGSPHLQKPARKLTKANLFEHAKMRLAAGVKPATINQDFTYLRVALKYAGSAWDDCEGISDAAVADAMPFMVKHGMVSKSTPRDRRPTEEELEKLRAYFREQAQHANTFLPMELLMDWQIASGRRIGETCKLLWEDWDRENHTIVVRKMKDPRNKNKRKVVALPTEAQAMLVDLYEKRDPIQPRIFPYNAKSIGASYTRAKNELGIVNLRLHDNRRECATRLIEKGYTTTQAIMVTGHETDHMLQRTYMRQKPENFKNGPLGGKQA